jgi:MFS family permease
VLAIDVTTYAQSLACYFTVRRGRVTVAKRDLPEGVEGPWARYLHELSEGIHYLRGKRYIVLLGISWALFIAAMMTQGVTTAPLSERILHAGANGYGWLNAGWAIGAFTAALYAPFVIARLGARRTVTLAMAALAISLMVAPHSRVVPAAILIYIVMGSGRGVGGVAISSGMMQMVPKHFMGRVQNTFYFLGTVLQLVTSFAVGAVAHNISLAVGFAIISVMYGLATLTAAWPVALPAIAIPAEESSDVQFG